MTTPSTTKELDEALDAGFDFAIRIKRALAETGPGGKTVTLDELLDTVSDGAVRESVQNLWDAIQRIIAGERPDIFDLIPLVTDAVLDFLGTLRDALADRRVTLDELLHGISDKGIRESLKQAIDGADRIPAELQGLDMWRMMALLQKIAGKLPALLAKS